MKKIKLTRPESSQNQQYMEKYFIRRLKKTDVIIFDVWNVLIFSVFNNYHILTLLEGFIQYPGISQKGHMISQLSKEQVDHLQNICMNFCMENPYMHNLWDYAQRKNKTIYIYNNSFFTDDYTRKVMKKFGFKNYLFSHEMMKGIHITEKPKKFSDIRYLNIEKLGNPYRPFNCLNITTALYNQIVNMKFHAGNEKKTFFYEYGFTCGGILACGFSQYLNKLAQLEKIDKFLFVSRDGYILKKVYDLYYKKIDTAYLLFSRAASYELIFEDFPDEYFEKNIKQRIWNQKKDNTLKQILQECDLEFMEVHLPKHNLSCDEVMDEHNFESFRKFLFTYRNLIISKFHDTSQAAKKYFLQETKGYKRVCIVDIGWRGTSATYLKYLLEKKYGWNGTVIGAMIGASCDSITQNHIRSGLLHAYAFDNELYRGTGKRNGKCMSIEETVCMEALFSAKSESLRRYTLDKNGTVDFLFAEKNRNKKIVEEIHVGITDFTKVFAPMLQKYDLEITSKDAYIPLEHLMQNRKIRNAIYHAYEDPL